MEKQLYDLTAPQKSIWLTEQYFTNTNINNICGTAIVSQLLDFNILNEAINLVIKNNDIFRLHFIEKSGVLKQYFGNFESKPIEIVELDSKEEISTLEQKLLSKVFDLNEELYEFKMFRVKNSAISGYMLNIHHIKADALTLGLCCKKIMQQYIALVNNETLETNEKATYENYINSEAEYIASKKYEADKNYWEEKFKELPNIVTIPTTKKDSTDFSCKANRYNYIIDKNKMSKIIEFCTKSKISVFNLFMGILSVYMYRVNNINDFVIGTPILNRTNFTEKNTLGMFINVAPLRVNINDNSSILELLSNIATDSMGLLRHQKYSYQSILENIRKTNPSIPNLYNIVLSYQITKANVESNISYETRWAFNGTCSNDIDIHLFDLDNTGELNISYDYKVDKYDEQDIIDLNNRLNYIIDQVLENSDIKIKELEIATPSERDRILNEFNNTKTDYPSDKTIVELFEEQVELHPDNIAVVFEDEKLTYRELNEKANQLANYLLKNGVKDNDIVGILFKKNHQTIISLIAILKCNATYLPLDIEYPNERINYILQDSNAHYLITDSINLEKITTSLKIININLFNYNFKNLLSIKSKISSPAYIIYTSGSTGKPKGVTIPQKGVVRLVKNTNYIKFYKNDRMIQTGSIVFDASTFEIWGALLNGLPLYIISKDNLLNTHFLENYIKNNKITIVWLTTSLFNLLSEQNPLIFETARILITGGDMVSPRHIYNVIDMCPNLTIIHAYGPTENTTYSTCYTIKTRFNDTIPVGAPIANSTCYIVSPNGKLQPPNTPGEIWVGGDGIGLGYLNNPSLTNEKFCENPFHDGKIYKTGDLAYWNNDGTITYQCRIDNQVKIRGFRVELSEIDNLILTFPEIKTCTTQIYSFNNTKKIYSYLVCKNKIDEDKLKLFLIKNLPQYMIPSGFIYLDQIPLTINGKINKKELPLPTFDKTSIDTNTPPRNDTDKILLQIISNILKLNNLSITSNIFEIGLDSLSAMNLTSQLYNQEKIQINVREIFEHPIISDLSDYINENISNNSTSIISLKSSSHYNSSRAQKRIYYTSNMNPDLCVYNISGGIEFDQTLKFNKICDIFKIIVNRHEAFRTYFEVIDGELYQKIIPKLDLNIESKNIPITQIDEYFKLFNTKFDLTKAPLLKVHVLYLDNNHTMILVNMHHIISDGTSMQILLDEFCKLYNNEELQKIKFTYKDFINYEQYFSGSEKYKQNKEFWLNEFSEEIPTLNLPTNYTRPSVFSYKGTQIHTKIDNKLTKSIIETSKKLKVTPYMFLLAAFYILLYKYTGQENIVVGTPIANRDISEFSNIIGMFVNTLAIRKRIHSNKTFINFLEETKEKCLDCFTHQDYPFDELVKELNISRDASRNPLFDTMFVYQNTGMNNLQINNINSKYYLPDTNISKFDLALEIIPKDTEYIMNFEYCTDLFEKNFIEALSKHYIQLIKNILNNINSKISDLEFLTIQEKNKLLYDFNNTKVNYNKNEYIYHLIDKQCLKTPNYTAITFKNKHLSYKELLDKSNSLANYLHTIGICRNSIVGIMLPRSLELLVTIQAVLKTGACYIPIDPTFPESRINYMLANSNASILLTFNDKKITNIKTLCVEFSNSALYNHPNLIFEPFNENTDPSYMIYTSGSTGNPKGVVLNHKALSNLTNYLNNYVEYLKNDYQNMAIASLTTISFDIFIFETLISLQKGLNVVMATENEQTMPDKLNSLIEKNNIKAFQLTPSRMEILLNNLDLIPQLKNIKFITLAGEALSNKLLRSILDLGNITVYNGYGPSETTVFSTFTDVTSHKNITIGKPLDNTQIYILDKDNNICPINVPGELCICGDGVGIGYKNIGPNVKNNYTYTPNSKRPMYRTGDLAKFLPNGEIMYLGRIDNQIKIRGLRIELDEIENKILEYPKIKKAIIIAKTDNNNRKYLVAYLTVKDRISINKLREHLRKYLPKYMVPAYFEILDEFPYLPNGKVNKKVLPEPHMQLNSQEFIPARNDLDKKILQLFEKLLNISPIGITDNFFELGGDSLLAINLQIEIMKIAEGISYADIFLNPTVQELTDKINSITNVAESLTDTLDLLNCNTTIQNYTQLPTNIEKNNVGNILLTGATGYLGIHVLNEFLKNETGKVYCLIRPEKGLTLETKLLNKLHFYFDNKYDDLINNRIIIIKGDITLHKLGLSEADYNELKDNISTIINCAAKVSHFGKYELYKKINVDGVKNLIDFCKENKKTLYHISTTSVSGEKLNTDDSLNISTNIFKENNFYINQIIDNVYVKSKFEAEKLIISELQNGLDGYILRIGNLMGRYSDGKFQQNIEENAYINRLLSFIRIRNVPKYFIEHTLEFTPVDCCADAIIKLLTHKTSYNRIFHLHDNNRILIKDLLNIFEKKYFKINEISTKEFNQLINSLLKSNNSSKYLSGLISDFDKEGNLNYVQKIQVVSEFSNSYLKKLNFMWPKIEELYIFKFLEYLKSLYNI